MNKELKEEVYAIVATAITAVILLLIFVFVNTLYHTKTEAVYDVSYLASDGRFHNAVTRVDGAFTKLNYHEIRESIKRDYNWESLTIISVKKQ